jgi:hypothetical protein
MKIFVSFSCILLIMAIFSCESKEEELKLKTAVKEKKEHEEINVKRNNIISGINAKYDIDYAWDTLIKDYTFSIQFKKVLETQYQLIDEIVINDIYEVEGQYYMEIFVGSIAIHYFTLTLSTEQVEQVLKYVKQHEEISLVVSIKNIKRANFKTEISDSEDLEKSIVILNNAGFFGNGDLIEIVPTNLTQHHNRFIISFEQPFCRN